MMFEILSIVLLHTLEYTLEIYVIFIAISHKIKTWLILEFGKLIVKYAI